MAGVFFFGMIGGFLGVFVAVTAAVVARDWWMLLILPAFVIVSATIGLIVDLWTPGPRS